MIAEPAKLLFGFTYLQGYCDESSCKRFMMFRLIVASSSSGSRSSIHGVCVEKKNQLDATEWFITYLLNYLLTYLLTYSMEQCPS